MCGRYQFTDNAPELREITQRLREQGAAYKTGEIFPTNAAPVLTAHGQALEPEAAFWGFPNFRGTGVVINARSETAHEKRMFKHPLLAGRCAVPTAGFFEWDANKCKHLFRKPGSEVLYLAGLYADFAGERRYVILTKAANASMDGIHDRMPVVLAREALVRWVFDPGETFTLLRTDVRLTHQEVPK